MGRLSAETTDPSMPVGDMRPAPVAHSVITEPGDAGLSAELTELSWLRMIPGPLPEVSAEKMPGVEGVTVMENESDVCPWYTTCTCVMAEVRPKGASAFT